MDVAPAAAEQIIERLRYGLPPPGYSRAFTAGSPAQLEQLENSLQCSGCAGGGALLVTANRGAGKSHLLHLIRETALRAGYVSSLVATAQEGVQFQRLDTVFGAVCRRLEIDESGRRGIGALFQSLTQGADASGVTPIRPERVALPSTLAYRPRPLSRAAASGEEWRSQGEGPRRRTTSATGGTGIPTRAWAALASKGRWDYSEYLHSPAMYVALRAWLRSEDQATRLLAEDWLTNPSAYREQRKHLYEDLIYRWRGTFRDPRPDWKFSADELLVLHRPGRTQVWDALDDLGRIARLAGRRGLVLLFDEVEDAFQQLSRADQQREAFRTLFRFFSRRQRLGKSCFAVTPDFARRCAEQLPLQAAGDVDPAPVTQLPGFELEAMSREAFRTLAANIRAIHGLAYGWDAAAALADGDLDKLSGKLWRASAPERLRWAIQDVMQTLDERLAAATALP